MPTHVQITMTAHRRRTVVGFSAVVLYHIAPDPTGGEMPTGGITIGYAAPWFDCLDDAGRMCTNI